MKKNYTHLVFVLDRSGSMASVKDDIIGGFNELLKEQKEVDGKVSVTLVQFDNKIDTLVDFDDIQEVEMLTESTFLPRGMTALRDAVGSTINSVGQKLSQLKEADRPNKVLVCVLTDGHENSSREFSPKDIKNLIEEQTDKYAWEFMFVGANQDAVTTGVDLGFKAGQTMSYAASDIGTRSVMNTISKKMATYSSIGGCSASLSFTREEIDQQEKLGAHKRDRKKTGSI